MAKNIFVICAIFIFIPAAGAQQPAPNKAITPKPAAATEKVAELQKTIAEDDHILQD